MDAKPVVSQPPRDPNAPPSPFSDQLKGLLEALECLYIRGNTSGRRQFVQNWPHAAPYVFDEELIIFDARGVESDADRSRRKDFEKKSEERRDALIALLETIEEKSVFDGMLQVEFVRGIVQRYSRDMLLYLYAGFIVNKLAAQSAEPSTGQPAAEPPAETPPQSSPPQGQL